MILDIILIAVIGLCFELFLPWWSIALAAFGICAWRAVSFKNAAMSGLSGLGLLWLLIATFIHFQSGGILTKRIAVLFNLNWSVVVILLTGILAGLVGGLAGISGYYLKKTRKTSD